MNFYASLHSGCQWVAKRDTLPPPDPVSPDSPLGGGILDLCRPPWTSPTPPCPPIVVKTITPYQCTSFSQDVWGPVSATHGDLSPILNPGTETPGDPVCTPRTDTRTGP